MVRNKRFISLKSRILASTLITVAISFMIIIAAIFVALFNSIQNTAREEFLAKGQKYAYIFEQKINDAINYLSIATSTLETQVNNGIADRGQMRDILFSIVDNYGLIDGTSIFFEPNAYDGRDSEYVGSEYGSKASGRVSWYIYLEGGQTVYLPQADINDTSDSEFEGSYYTEAKRTNKPTYTEPFVYEVGGHDIPMFTLSYPMNGANGDFLGAVTVDLFLEDLYAQLQSEEIYETGYMVVTNDKNQVIYSPIFEDISKSREEARVNYALPPGNETVEYSNAASLINGKDSFVATVPIYIPQLDSVFYVSVAAPTGEIYADGIRLLVILAIFSVLLIASIGVILYININTSIKPLVALADVSSKVANGEFDFQLPKTRNDEIGTLANNFESMSLVINNLIADIFALSIEHENGNINAALDISEYKGIYAEVGSSVSKMTNSYADMLNDVMGVLQQFVIGDFSADIQSYKGEKEKLNFAIRDFRNNLAGVEREIRLLISAGHEGKLSSRADTQNFKGNWAELLELLNNLLDTVIQPINESSIVLSKVAAGDFSAKMTGDYQGDFLAIKQSINTTVSEISSYISEISNILTEMSQNNLSLEIKREYVGEFSLIKASLNLIIRNFNEVLSEISQVSNEVNSEASKIAVGAKQLADGSSIQTDAVDKISSSITMVNESTAKNSGNAKEVSQLTSQSKETALKGDSNMDSMLQSMSEIKAASINIEKIIKVIEDISFQTNLLALNAAVEAARAGEHGKGFGVVAEEVRNLASRTQVSANETRALIEDTISKVTSGSSIAILTANSLKEIVEIITHVSDLVEGIVLSSEEQLKSTLALQAELNHVSVETQKINTSAYENSSISEILLDRAQSLEKLSQLFKIKAQDK